MNLDKLKFFDGAFGTYYYSKTGVTSACELANLNDPETVLLIHNEYIAAGVNAIKTNTYGANRQAFGEKLEEIITSAWNTAQKAADSKDVLVFADIGCIPADNESACLAYMENARIFLSLGAKYFLFETLSEFDVIVPALKLIKEKRPDSVIAVSFAVSQDGYTKKGHYYRTLLQSADKDENTDIVGLNCLCGPSHMLKLIKNMPAVSKRFLAMPNSGYPSTVNGRTFFQDNAEYFSDKLSEIYLNGADFVGGCCGSTPKHIRLAIDKIKTLPEHIEKKKLSDAFVPTVKRTIHDAIISGEKIIAAELDPPADSDCSFIIDAAAQFKKAGCQIITVADSPLSRTRADSIMTASKIKREVSIDVLPHISCRDKNIIALKGGLLAAAFENIDRVLVITGDPVSKTEHINADAVFNFNSFELINYISSLNEDVFLNSPFIIGGALNVNAKNFDNELRRAEKKIANGASFLMTQPIFSKTAIANFLRAKEELNCRILAGIMPVAGYKNAMFLVNEVSGIEIPQDVIDSLKDKTPDEVAEISCNYSLGIAKEVYDKTDGFYLMTPLKKTNITLKLIEKIKELKNSDERK